MLKAIKIRLYPTETQQITINKLLGCCRLVYNCCLEHRNKIYEETKESGSLSKSYNYFCKLKEMEQYSFLKTDSHSKVIQQSLRDQDDAFKNFFTKKSKFPRFKSKKDNEQKCRFPKDAISGVRGKTNGIKGNRISIIKPLKDIHFKCSRKDESYLNKNQELISSATLTKTCSGKYYLSILIDKPHEVRYNKSNNMVGIDLGIKDLIITSNGEKFENKQFYRKQENKLKKLNRKFTKTQKDSNNHQKLRVKIAKLNEKIKNQRLWYIHHIVNQLLNENQVIVMEDLNVSGMMQNHKLAKSIQDVSLYELKRILQYKASWEGKQIIFIDRFYPSSKLCSDCGYKKDDLQLSDREWVCPECGVIHDRDINAAVNILNEGKRIIGLSSPEFKRVGEQALVSSMTLEQNVKY
jgi:putative transposase